MEALRPGHHWKTPFIWEPGCPEPSATSTLRFAAVDDEWLSGAAGLVLSNSLDESDRYAIAHASSLSQAVAELLALDREYFRKVEGWWRAGVDAEGNRVGFVLPVLFQSDARWRDGRPEGTIFYMGVLPQFRGHGFASELLAEATRAFIAADCWRIFCDTGTDNHPMVNAFRKAGYKERSPWQRPLA
jgi:ribosomal protein S18 acetylase RimI-like enzyme